LDRLFLDANILFSAAYHPASSLRRLWTLDVEIITSDYAADEARRNLRIQKPNALTDLNALLQMMTIVANLIQIVPPDVSLPIKDRPILAAALACGATHLLTGDKRHFRKLYGQVVDGTLILAPTTYLGKITDSA
jgi:predicted nucleic acid-binding protein